MRKASILRNRCGLLPIVLLPLLLHCSRGGEEAIRVGREENSGAGGTEEIDESVALDMGTNAGSGKSDDLGGDILHDGTISIERIEDQNGDGIVQSGEAFRLHGSGLYKSDLVVSLWNIPLGFAFHTDSEIVLTPPGGMPTGETFLEVRSASEDAYLRMAVETRAEIYLSLDEPSENFRVYALPDIASPRLSMTLSESGRPEAGGNVGAMAIDNFCEQIFVHRPAARKITALERVGFAEIGEITLDYEATALGIFPFPQAQSGIMGQLYVTDLTNNKLHYYQLYPLIDGRSAGCPVFGPLPQKAGYAECIEPLEIPRGFSRPVSLGIGCPRQFVAVGCAGAVGGDRPGVVVFTARVQEPLQPEVCRTIDPSDALYDTIVVDPGDNTAEDAHLIDVKYNAFYRVCPRSQWHACEVPNPEEDLDCCIGNAPSGLLLFTNNHKRYLYITNARDRSIPPQRMGDLERLPDGLTGIRLDDVWPEAAPSSSPPSPGVVGEDIIDLRISVGIELATEDPQNPGRSICPPTPIGDACRSFAYIWNARDDGIFESEGGPSVSPAKLVVIDLDTFERISDPRFGTPYVTPVDDALFPRGVCSPFNSGRLFFVGRDFLDDAAGGGRAGLYLSEHHLDTGKLLDNTTPFRLLLPMPDKEPFRDLE